MNVTRRSALLSTLFGAGYVGLRALATGLPASILVNPRKAFADPGAMGGDAAASNAQFVIFNTSYLGDPINANAPGMYGDPAIVHPADTSMAATPLVINGQQTTAALPWSNAGQTAAAGAPAGWQSVLDRTQFWHIMTNTPVHPKEPQVLELMGNTFNVSNEMFPSILAKGLAPSLYTIQTQPLSVGATNPTETILFEGSPLPSIPPTALRATLANLPGPLTQLQSLRDSTMNELYGLYKAGSPAQQQFVDSLVTSQTQVRSIAQNLLDALSSIKDNTASSQITAAITLILMKVSPVVAVHIPFGGDNHLDVGLANETAQTVSGVATIWSLMQQLASANLTDQVTFLSLNVFGRTLTAAGQASNGQGSGGPGGRQHNPNHQVSIAIGSTLRGGVFGGVGPLGANMDYGATSMNSTTGSASGDIQAIDTLPAYAMTMMQGVGVASMVTPSGQPIISSTGGTAKVVASALS